MLRCPYILAMILNAQNWYHTCAPAEKETVLSTNFASQIPFCCFSQEAMDNITKARTALPKGAEEALASEVRCYLLTTMFLPLSYEYLGAYS